MFTFTLGFHFALNWSFFLVCTITLLVIFILQKIFLPGKYAAKIEMNDPPLLTFGDWIARLWKIHTSDTIFIEYVCTRSFGRLLARARYKRFLCVLLLIISHGEEVYAQFTWRHHRTYDTSYNKANTRPYLFVFVCMCRAVTWNWREHKWASDSQKERKSNFWWWDTNFTIYAIQNSRKHEVLGSSLNIMSC